MTQPKDVTVKIELITVAKAQLILKRNKSNRPLNGENSNFISHAMKQNKFMFTGESIIIGKNGDLMDGQHRLDAVVLTGKEQYFVVVYGVDNDAFKHIDIGKNRSAGDVLSIQNIVNPNSFASIARFILNFNRGGIARAASKMSNKKMKITNSEISDFVIKYHNSLQESRTYGFVKENVLLPGNLLSAFHYIFKKIDENAAADFCKKFSDGKELKDTDAISILRQEMKADIQSQRKMSAEEKMALICIAWNHYRNDKKVTSLKWNPDKDEFPKPI